MVATVGPGVSERAREIPVRITLIWDFLPGAPARGVRMNKTNCRNPIRRAGKQPGLRKMAPVFSQGEDPIFKLSQPPFF